MVTVLPKYENEEKHDDEWDEEAKAVETPKVGLVRPSLDHR